MVSRRHTFLFSCVMIACFQRGLCIFSFTEDSINLRVHENRSIGFAITNKLDLINFLNVTVNFIVEHEDIIDVEPKSINITDEIFNEGYVPVIIKGLAPGKSDISTKITPDQLNKSRDVFTIVSVHRNDVIVAISNVLGWIYIFAWSFSFYPQVWTNFFRKSVVGLSFDFVSLNIVGYACYSIFNVGMYAIPEIRIKRLRARLSWPTQKMSLAHMVCGPQDYMESVDLKKDSQNVMYDVLRKKQYSERYPQSVIPVLSNDIIFAVHGSCITIITGIQCLIYESNNQKISNIVRCQHGLIGAIAVFSLILVNFKVILWLDFIYVCSYIKLFLTLTKYIPQAYMNYCRKSTVGWNIYNVVADVIGGLFSIAQMFLNAHNYDEWESLLENPTKFWLGVVSILFDVIFMVQHYILYRQDAASETESILDEEETFIEKFK